MLAVVSNWLTPTFLFLFLNLVIGTIALTARFTSHKKPLPHQHGHHQQLGGSPSFLERVRSFDLYNYKFPPFSSGSGTQIAVDFAQTAQSENTTHDDPHPAPRFERVPSLLERVKSIKLSSFYRSHPETELAAQADTDPVPDMGHSSDSGAERQVKRSKSESVIVPKREVQEKMKKSASEKVAADDEEEEEREELEKTVSSEDEEVDAKADNFINKFKQQLRLQRLDSLRRYGDMLKAKQK